MVPFSPACQVIKNLNGDFGTFTLYYTLLSILSPLEGTFYQHLQGRIRFNTAYREGFDGVWIFLAVHNSSIGHLVPCSLAWSDQTNNQTLQSDPRVL